MSLDTRNLLSRYAALTVVALCLPLAAMMGASAVPQRGGASAKKPTAAPKKQSVKKPGAKQARTGAQVYKEDCAACHGAKGEGAQAYNRALTGDKSVGQLAQFIHDAMPPGQPKQLPRKDAEAVAAYIHEAFYSPVAQARIRPPRVELSRLTVRQYRSAVADLIGSFRPRPDAAAIAAVAQNPQGQGLRGQYFKTGRMRRDQAILERTDPEIKFDFKTAGALKEQDDPYQFAMRWDGSVLAPETGEYEFIIRTEHAAELWVNDTQKSLIDARIKSGDTTEYRATIFLLAGRLYPLRLEFSKGVQGVNDLKKLKEKPPLPASLALEWKVPKSPVQVVPQRNLFAVTVPETYVPSAAFPPDDRSQGYERGASVSRAWTEATTEAAIETAGYVTARLRELSGIADDAPDRDAKMRAFCRTFVERAFRRPLPDALARVIIDKQFEGAPDPETAAKRVVLLTLSSPRFLYREISTPATGTPDPYNVASRLSFALWDSLPDEELLKAAAAGQLTTREQVARHAERMAQDLRARAKLSEFFLQWLKVDHHPDLKKNPKKFPNFDETVASDLRASLELSLEQVVWSEKSDFRELLLTDKTFVNNRLARVYGGGVVPGNGFRPVALDYGKRSGILTHPYVLASFAYVDSSSPIHRGVLVARNMLGRLLKPPVDAFSPLSPDLHPNLTTRQRIAMQTKPASCASCHTLINPLGFTLEKFDAIGKMRPAENGKPIDASGGYITPQGKEVKFRDSRDLAQFLAGSEEVHAAFVEKLFQNIVKQPVQAFGKDALPTLRKSFAANQFNIRKQFMETAVFSALQTRQTSGTISAANTSPSPTKETGTTE